MLNAVVVDLLVVPVVLKKVLNVVAVDLDVEMNVSKLVVVDWDVSKNVS